jgi:hypothetical protein
MDASVVYSNPIIGLSFFDSIGNRPTVSYLICLLRSREDILKVNAMVKEAPHQMDAAYTDDRTRTGPCGSRASIPTCGAATYLRTYDATGIRVSYIVISIPYLYTLLFMHTYFLEAILVEERQDPSISPSYIVATRTHSHPVSPRPVPTTERLVPDASLWICLSGLDDTDRRRYVDDTTHTTTTPPHLSSIVNLIGQALLFVAQWSNGSFLGLESARN